MGNAGGVGGAPSRVARRVAVVALAFVLCSVLPAFAADRLERRAGEDRFATLIAAGSSSLAASAIVVGDSPAADAAAGAAFASATGALLLIATPDGLRHDVAEHLRTHMREGTVYIAGGTAAVSQNVDAQARDLGYAVRRVAGTDRYDTAARLAEVATPDARQVIVASSDDAATACASATAAHGYAVLLTDGHRLPPSTAAALDRSRPSVIVAINDAADAVDETTAIRSDTPSRTCVEIAESLHPAPDRVSLAGAERPVDTFIAAAYSTGAPLLLLGSSDDRSALDYLRDHADRVVTATAYGGSAGLPARVLAEAEAAINGCPPGSPDIHQPFAPFEITVTTDASTYGRGRPVRITVEACNRGTTAYTQQHPNPLVTITVLDERGIAIATEPERTYTDNIETRSWNPGECTTEKLLDWDQHTGATLTSAPHDDSAPAVDGNYRIEADWNGSDGDPCHGHGATLLSDQFAIR